MTDTKLETFETTVEQQRGRPFTKGRSGNPDGRPKGARHKTTIAMQALLYGESESLTRKAVELALRGDMTAMRLCLERLMPPCKDTPVSIDLPTIKTSTDVMNAQSVIVNAVAAGEVTPTQGSALSDIVTASAKAIELHDLDIRITQLEQHLKDKT